MTPPSLPPRRPRALLSPTSLLMVLALTFASLAAVTSATERSAQAATKRLAVSPTNYVAGQSLRWKGNIGVRGKRRIVLQFNMGRAADGWVTVSGFRARTRADGSFAFNYPAPGMLNIKMRVKSGRFTTPARLFFAKSQDLTIWVTGQDESRTNAPASVRAGQSFGISVDTTPDNLGAGEHSKNIPAIPGRGLTLQKRVDGDTWVTLDRSTTDARGHGSFSGIEQSSTTVYRVRQENVTNGANDIGWTQSFPLFVLTGQNARAAASARTATTKPTTTSKRRSYSPGSTASKRFGWTPALWDFAWEYGESLSDRPTRGNDLKGSWVDYSDGSGRVARHNGGLQLDSKRFFGAGPGDFGTTRATLRGNPAAYGRWEARLRIRSAFERSHDDYKMVTELVPANPADYDCGAHNIEIAGINPFSKRITFGARSPGLRWNGSASAGATPFGQAAYHVAVEVSRRHITWFLNGTPVGTVTNRKAISGMPMTMRISLEGKGDSEMNQVSLNSDWQRAFPLDTARLTKTKKRLTQSSASAGC